MKNKTRLQVLSALFAALTAVFSQLAIPIHPIPITLGTLAVLLSGGFLGKKYGTLSMVIYILLGIIGLPVFSSMRSGAGVLVGPSGGYIIGFILTAFVIGAIVEKYEDSYKAIFLGGILGSIACYVLGTLWFIMLTGKGLVAALGLCVIPFLPGDLAKVIIATILIKKYRKMLLK